MTSNWTAAGHLWYLGSVVGQDEATSQSASRRFALVLPGGGARGAYQAGVLSRLGERMPAFAPTIVTGVSVGAINAAYVANHPGALSESGQSLTKLWSSLTTEQVVRTSRARLARTAFRWGAQLFGGGRLSTSDEMGLLETQPLAELLSRELGEARLDVVREKLRDGRLRGFAVTATSYATGKAITFCDSAVGEQGLLWQRPYREGYGTTVGVDHVMASCALPIIFPAVRVEGRWYGDGSIRQSAPLSPALHLGANRLLVITTAAPPPLSERDVPLTTDYPSPARVAGVVLNALLFDSVSFDATYATRISELLGRGGHSHDHLVPAEVCVLKPSLDLGKLAASYQNHFPSALRYLTRGLGSVRADSTDLIATLLFESAFTSRLIELGREDLDRAWPEVEAFLTR